MNIKEYGEAVSKIHNPKALSLWVFYKNKYRPLKKEYILKNLPDMSEIELDECVAYLDKLNFKIKIL